MGWAARRASASRRHSALATAAIIREDNFVRVKVPEISAGYLPFGWWMKSGEFHLIDSDEAGGENITIEGPGLLHKLATGSLYHSSTVDDQPARGSADREGLWWWIDEPYGAIADPRLSRKGATRPTLTLPRSAVRWSSSTSPSDAGTTRTAVAWPNIDAEFQVDIGTDLMTVHGPAARVGQPVHHRRRLRRGRPHVHCYQTYGDDLTGAVRRGHGALREGRQHRHRAGAHRRGGAADQQAPAA